MGQALAIFQLQAWTAWTLGGTIESGRPCLSPGNGGTIHQHTLLLAYRLSVLVWTWFNKENYVVLTAV